MTKSILQTPTQTLPVLPRCDPSPLRFCLSIPEGEIGSQPGCPIDVKGLLRHIVRQQRAGHTVKMCK